MVDEGRALEAERVFASVARSLLGESVKFPTVARFEIHERLGSGGMGEVYGAYDPLHEREVALKVLREELGADAVALRRLKREARVLAGVEHRHVVAVYEVGEVDGGVFVAMERLHGETLADFLRHTPTVEPSRVCEWIVAIADAVATVHAQGVIHRDLKPANLLLASREGEGEPRITVLDFGIAKGGLAGTLGASTASGTVMGTPHYMSPEQARDSTKIDHRCDLWALAIITYECMVGQRPYLADNLGELAVQLLTKPAPVPSQHGSVPAGFDAWFAKATDPQIDRRFADARAMADALVDAVVDTPKPAPAPDSGRGRRWAVAAAFGLTAGALGGWLYVDGQSGAEPTASPAVEAPMVPTESSEAPIEAKVPPDLGGAVVPLVHEREPAAPPPSEPESVEPRERPVRPPQHPTPHETPVDDLEF